MIPQGNDNRAYPKTSDSLSWKIVTADNETTKTVNGQSIETFTDLEKVVPGDVIYYPATGNGQHLLMVLSVEYVAGSRVVKADKVKIIESTYDPGQGYEFAKVVNSNDLNDYSDEDWIIVRLKPKN